MGLEGSYRDHDLNAIRVAALGVAGIRECDYIVVDAAREARVGEVERVSVTAHRKHGRGVIEGILRAPVDGVKGVETD
jgi:hypothetical protein